MSRLVRTLSLLLFVLVVSATIAAPPGADDSRGASGFGDAPAAGWNSVPADLRQGGASAASVLGFALRDMLDGPYDPTAEVRVVIYHRDVALARVAREVGDRFAGEWTSVRAELAADLAAEVGTRPVRSREDERGSGVPLGPVAPHRAELLERLDALQGAVRAEIAAAIEFETTPLLDDIAGAVIALGGEVTNRIHLVSAVVARVPAGILEDLAEEPAIRRIELDALIGSELNVSNIAMGSDTFWGAGFTGGTFDVAIADSGIDDTHPAFLSQTVLNGVFLTTAGNPANDNTADDVNGHGSHVGGISASADLTRKGVAYGLDKVFNVKAGFDLDGNDGGSASMYHSDGMDGVDWAVTYSGDNADVVNLSYGGTAGSDDSSYLRFYDAVVSDLEVAVAISAGNSGPGAGTVGSPGIAPNVLCVANMYDNGTTSRLDDTIASSSSRGPTPGGRRKPDIAAPGTNIASCNNNWEGANADFVNYTGTSMAAPQVAGALVLLCDAGVTDPLAQKALLLNTAEDRGTAGWDATYGWGYIDLDHAYEHRTDIVSDSIVGAPAFKLYAGPALTGDTATVVWNRRATYAGSTYPSTYYGLSNLDLYLYDQADGSVLDSDTTTIDNVQQVEAASVGNVVVKVDVSGSIAGAASEPFALCTEENFVAVNPAALTVSLVVPATVPPTGGFVAQARVQNATGAAMAGCSVELTLPAGFSLNSGSLVQAVGVVGDGDTEVVNWNVVAPAGTGSHDIDVDLQSLTYGETFDRSDSSSVSLVGAPPGADGIGLHQAAGKALFLKEVPGPGNADIAFRYGSTTMTAVAGDWDGDGDDTIGMYLASTGTFFLRNSNSKGPANVTFRYGGANRIPLSGDWDGDGTDTIGIYDATHGTFFLRNSNTPGPSDVAFRYGPANRLPVVGDWNGDGTDTIGIYDPTSRAFFLRDTNNRGVADYTFTFGPSSGVPIVGDWNGDGVDTVGVYDASAREFSLTDTNQSQSPDSKFRFGGSGVTPITGNWNAD